MKKYRFLLKDAINGAFHEDVLPELVEDDTTSFIIAALRRFDISPGPTVSITTDGGNYSNSMGNVSRCMMIRIRRQRCLFHVMKDFTKKAYDGGKLKDLRGALGLINYMFFWTPENLEKLGKNAESTGRTVSRLSEKEATLRILQLVRDMYSGDPIIGKFLKTHRKNRREVFQYLEDDMVQKTNNISEHHFSMRPELLKKRFKTDDDLLRTSYWYHRLSTES